MDVECGELEKQISELTATLAELAEALNQRDQLNQKIATSERQRKEMEGKVRSILVAVTDSEFGGIKCVDVNGVNWFDARKELLQSLRSTPETPTA